MTKIVLNDLVNLQNENSAVNTINTNNAVIETAFDNTLSRDGTQPNSMGATLDMNSHQIINLPAPSTVNSPARVIDVVSNPTIVIPGTGTSGHVVPFLDGNNTWSGTNTFSTTATFSTAPVLPSNSIANASLATMAANTVKGSIAGGTPADLTKTQITTLINPVTSSLSGAAPASGGGTTNFLRADATWVDPNNRVLLNTITANNTVGTLQDITSFTNAYNNYEIIIDSVTPATNATTLSWIVYNLAFTPQGTSYLTTAYCSANGGALVFLNPTNIIPITNGGTVSNNSGGYGISGTMRISNPVVAAPHMWNGQLTYLNTGGTVTLVNTGGMWNNASGVGGFGLISSSGNLLSGNIKVYGIK